MQKNDVKEDLINVIVSIDEESDLPVQPKEENIVKPISKSNGDNSEKQNIEDLLPYEKTKPSSTEESEESEDSDNPKPSELPEQSDPKEKKRRFDEFREFHIDISANDLGANPEAVKETLDRLPPVIDQNQAGNIVEIYFKNSGKTRKTYHLQPIFEKFGTFEATKIKDFVQEITRNNFPIKAEDFLWLLSQRITAQFNRGLESAYDVVRKNFERRNLPSDKKQIESLLRQSNPIALTEPLINVLGRKIKKTSADYEQDIESNYFAGNVKLHFYPHVYNTRIQIRIEKLEQILDQHLGAFAQGINNKRTAENYFRSICSYYTTKHIPDEVINIVLPMATMDPDRPLGRQKFMVPILQLTAELTVLKYGLLDDPEKMPDLDSVKKRYLFFVGEELDLSKLKINVQT